MVNNTLAERGQCSVTIDREKLRDFGISVGTFVCLVMIVAILSGFTVGP
jgi:hypothetical protein